MSVHSKSGMGLERMQNSASGNPRFRAGFADGSSFVTVRDGSVNHGIGNSDFTGDVQIHVNQVGEIIGIRNADGVTAGYW